jgi:hypothetical protein
MDLKKIIAEVINEIKNDPDLLNQAQNLFIELIAEVSGRNPIENQSEVILTRQMIEDCRCSGSRAFTSACVRNFGLSFPLESGWIERLEGKKIKALDYKKAYESRDITKRKRF